MKLSNFINKRTPRVRLMAAALGTAVAVTSLSALSIGAASASVPTLLVYDAMGYGPKVEAAFNATNPGFKLVDYSDSTGPLFTKIQAEIAAGNTKWGMFWADGATEFAALDKMNALVKNVAVTSAYNTAGTPLVPADGSFAPMGLTVAGALCYDTGAVSSSNITVPKTWNQLLSLPNGVLGMNDPSQSGPTFPLIAGVFAHLGGITAKMNPTAAQVNNAINLGEQFYLKLKANGLVVHPTNGPTLGALESNPPSIAMATIQSSACYGDINLKPTSAWPTGKVAYMDYSIALPSNIAVNAKLSPALQADAKKFIAWLSTPKGQHLMQSSDPYGDGPYWPVIKGVSPESFLPNYSATHAYAINPYVWGPLENKINAWFTQNIIN